MDSSPNTQQYAESPYFNAVFRMSELVQQRQTCPWLWSDAIYQWTRSGSEHEACLKILHEFTDKVIDERIDEREVKKRDQNKQRNSETTEEQEKDVFTRKKRLAFLDLLLEAYDKGVREEVDTFMFEGHDTTAAGITWALYLLGRHPKMQQRVNEEVDTFFEQRSEKLTVEDMKELRYLECVIKESQRLFPSVPFFSRSTTEDCYLDGYFVPKGTAVGVSTIGLHRNPEVWSAPLDFNPDRFLPENSQGRHPFAFVPFSAGPRNCIGQRFAILEEKTILAYILRFFHVSSKQSFDEMKTCAELITRPKDGIFVSLCRRK